MKTHPEYDPNAPGLAFSALLALAENSRLIALFENQTIEALEGLEPGFSRSEKLAELAINMLNPTEILLDADKRNVVISLMPLVKAQELCKKFGVRVGKDPFADAVKHASKEENQADLLTFFGVVDDPIASHARTSAVDRIQIKYGLFDHQRNAAFRTERMLSEIPHKGVLHMPTGAGKTRTAMHIVASHLKRHVPTLVVWLAQSLELLEQAAEEFQKSWYSLGNREVDLYRLWGSTRIDFTSARDGVVVAGLGKMASLEKRSMNDLLKLADRSSLIVIDEAHQSIAPTYRSVLDFLSTKRPSTKLLGLTATPGRTWADIDQDEELSSFFGGQKITLEIEGYSNPVTYLMDEGYLSRPAFRNLNVQAGLDLSQEDFENMSAAIDVPGEILERLGQSTQRNIKIISECEELISRHQRVIVFAPSVANARMLAAIMIARGSEALVVTGETPRRERERAIRVFKGGSKKPMVMFNYGVLTTGFDAPLTSAAIIARPTQSLVLYSQMVGRATRGEKAGGNKTCEIVTVTDTDMHGFGDVADAFSNWEDVWDERQ